MATIDIRNGEISGAEIDRVYWVDGAFVRRLGGGWTLECDNGEEFYFEGELDELDNLIKALQKAKELWG